jgi:chromatin segregation and condensation protein Rec8/ScpA/Scc1 (kleisin family)
MQTDDWSPVPRAAPARLLTISFLALLEMMRLGASLLHQERLCAPIRIKKAKEFAQVMSQSISLDEQRI